MQSDPTKQQIFYIHGGSAYSNHGAFLEHLRTATPRDLPWLPPRKKWTDTLRADLGDDFEVFMPTMPNSRNAKYEEWKIWFERHFEYLRDGITLIGWSQGGVFLAKYLSENVTPFSINNLFLLAAPYDYFEIKGEDGGDFYPNISNLASIEQKVGHIVILSSEDDPVVPYEHSVKYSGALPKAELMTFKDKNHFLIEEFPELIEKIKELARKADKLS